MQGRDVVPPEGGFDRTYEGLKPRRYVSKRKLEATGFDRTYEGLKPTSSPRPSPRTRRFDRTYEGLKR